MPSVRHLVNYMVLHSYNKMLCNQENYVGGILIQEMFTIQTLNEKSKKLHLHEVWFSFGEKSSTGKKNPTGKSTLIFSVW